MREIYRGKNIRISFGFEIRDMWLGIFWDLQEMDYLPIKALEIYICLIPMLPILIEKSWSINGKD